MLKILKRLKSKKGSVILEALVSLVIYTLGLTSFAIMILQGNRIFNKATEMSNRWETYSADLERQTGIFASQPILASEISAPQDIELKLNGLETVRNGEPSVELAETYIPDVSDTESLKGIKILRYKFLIPDEVTVFVIND
jgi:hypothetical protein